MKGIHAFCPQSGAELSDQRYYVQSNIAYRQPLDETLNGEFWTRGANGELTTAKLVSSKTAILNHFRRCHQRHYSDSDGSLVRKAALAIHRLKANTDAWDTWIWYALAERLDRAGYDVDWMFAHADPRCPRCSSRIKVESATAGYVNLLCGVSCGSGSPNRTIAIVERIRDAYNATFDEPISQLTIM